ncbi:MAG: hypothetical protein OEX11_08215, partial [Nitrosomonas sp.]|nr:hypothetical protein [Nitrosomonas sp.]
YCSNSEVSENPSESGLIVTRSLEAFRGEIGMLKKIGTKTYYCTYFLTTITESNSQILFI